MNKKPENVMITVESHTHDKYCSRRASREIPYSELQSNMQKRSVGEVLKRYFFNEEAVKTFSTAKERNMLRNLRKIQKDGGVSDYGFGVAVKGFGPIRPELDILTYLWPSIWGEKASARESFHLEVGYSAQFEADIEENTSSDSMNTTQYRKIPLKLKQKFFGRGYKLKGLYGARRNMKKAGCEIDRESGCFIKYDTKDCVIDLNIPYELDSKKAVEITEILLKNKLFPYRKKLSNTPLNIIVNVEYMAGLLKGDKHELLLECFKKTKEIGWTFKKNNTTI